MMRGIKISEPTLEMWQRLFAEVKKSLAPWNQIVPRRVLGQNLVVLKILSLLAQKLHFELHQAERLPMLDQVRSFLFDCF